MVPPGIWSHWGSSLGASRQRYRNRASSTWFNFKLLLSFHLVFPHSHHRWPLVWYKHFKSRPYDCLHSPKRGLKTSCCCFLRSVWNPQRNNPDGWPGLCELPQKAGEWCPLLRPQLSLFHTGIWFLLNIFGTDLLFRDRLSLRKEEWWCCWRSNKSRPNEGETAGVAWGTF